MLSAAMAHREICSQRLHVWRSDTDLEVFDMQYLHANGVDADAPLAGGDTSPEATASV